MDFLLYLSPAGQQLINLIAKSKYEIQENSYLCKKYPELFGYNLDKQFVVCTKNIKNTISPVNYYVNETVYHEAVHVAQACAKGSLGVKNPILSLEKLNDVARSVNYNRDAFTYEVEAYYLEDKPDQVLSYVKKYCM